MLRRWISRAYQGLPAAGRGRLAGVVGDVVEEDVGRAQRVRQVVLSRSLEREPPKLIANFSNAPSFHDPSQQWRPKFDTVVPEYPALAFHPHLGLYDLTRNPREPVDLAKKPECTAKLQHPQLPT